MNVAFKPTNIVAMLFILVFLLFAITLTSGKALAHQQSIEEYIESPEFVAKVEHIIVDFIKKQQRLQQQAEAQAQMQRGNNIPAVDTDKDRIRGKITAEYSLIEYSDFECAYCKRFHAIASKFEQQHEDVNWVYRHYPLEFHNPLAALEAEASECAAEQGGNPAFWQYADLIFANSTSNGKAVKDGQLASYAKQLGLNLNSFNSCMDEHRMADIVNQHIIQGRAANIQGTPANYLRHNPTGLTLEIPGAQPLKNLNAALQQLKQQVSQVQ